MNMEKKALLLSTFPGLGAKAFIENNPDISIIYIDPEAYQWVPEYPLNFIKAIEENMPLYDYIIVPSSDSVNHALEIYIGPHFVLYPDISLKDEYLDRYRSSELSHDFIDKINSVWDKHISNIQKSNRAHIIKFDSGQYLSDIFDHLIEYNGFMSDEKMDKLFNIINRITVYPFIPDGIGLHGKIEHSPLFPRYITAHSLTRLDQVSVEGEKFKITIYTENLLREYMFGGRLFTLDVLKAQMDMLELKLNFDIHTIYNILLCHPHTYIETHSPEQVTIFKALYASRYTIPIYMEALRCGILEKTDTTLKA